MTNQKPYSIQCDKCGNIIDVRNQFMIDHGLWNTPYDSSSLHIGDGDLMVWNYKDKIFQIFEQKTYGAMAPPQQLESYSILDQALQFAVDSKLRFHLLRKDSEITFPGIRQIRFQNKSYSDSDWLSFGKIEDCKIGKEQVYTKENYDLEKVVQKAFHDGFYP